MSNALILNRLYYDYVVPDLYTEDAYPNFCLDPDLIWDLMDHMDELSWRYTFICTDKDTYAVILKNKKIASFLIKQKGEMKIKQATGFSFMAGLSLQINIIVAALNGIGIDEETLNNGIKELREL